mmetsp:Transcript_58139/g.173514  ORF Transcript_58139/g.173514 Transcript_58139/m.173514 type:complete len:81 (+) Transcript_58139:1112-1354(+)
MSYSDMFPARTINGMTHNLLVGCHGSEIGSHVISYSSRVRRLRMCRSWTTGKDTSAGGKVHLEQQWEEQVRGKNFIKKRS